MTMRVVLSILLFSTLLAAPLSAQYGGSAGQVEVSRAELEALLAQYEETAASSSYSGALRERARTDAALIRQRIETGDFLVGDQIALSVEGEPTLSAVFVVQAGPSLNLPTIGAISLRGVLRSELESHLRTELSRYFREPVVQAQSSIRVLITGQVLRAGYHVLPTNTVFSDALNTAGGATALADLEKIRVEREDRVIWEPNALRAAIVEGRTLDQLSIQAGDHVVVPEQTGGATGSLLRTMTTVVAPVVLLVVAVMQAF